MRLDSYNAERCRFFGAGLFTFNAPNHGTYVPSIGALAYKKNEGPDGAEPSFGSTGRVALRVPSSHLRHPKNLRLLPRHKIPPTHARTVRVRGDSMRPCTTCAT